MRKLLALSFGILLMFAAGCSNYRLGGTAVELPFSSVYVRPVRNVSFAPQAAPILTDAISKAIMRTPDLRVAYQSDAQAMLDTSIIEFVKQPVATKANDTALAASYRVTARAQCTLTLANGQVVFKDRPVSAFITVYSIENRDYMSSEFESMPVLMNQLGEKIKDAVIGIW